MEYDVGKHKYRIEVIYANTRIMKKQFARSEFPSIAHLQVRSPTHKYSCHFVCVFIFKCLSMLQLPVWDRKYVQMESEIDQEDEAGKFHENSFSHQEHCNTSISEVRKSTLTLLC